VLLCSLVVVINAHMYLLLLRVGGYQRVGRAMPDRFYGCFRWRRAMPALPIIRGPLLSQPNAVSVTKKVARKLFERNASFYGLLGVSEWSEGTR